MSLILVVWLASDSGAWSSLCAEEPSGGKEGILAPLPAEVPPTKDNPMTPEKVELGKQLFFDPRLSGDNKRSCASCHIPAKAFTDGLAQAEGLRGKPLARNTPTLLNVGFYPLYFLDGRASTLEDLALVPIKAADEMGQDIDQLEEELNRVPGYVKQFEAVFGKSVSRDGIARALAAFQRTLVTRLSPFDRYLQGEKGALSDEAKEGLRLFAGEAGCSRCHRGVLLSDGKFYRLGVGFRDKGRGSVTGKQADNYKFRTPSLRNIALTGPYMHDGSQKTLEDVITFYYRGVPTRQSDGLSLDVEPLLGQSFSEISKLVAFLEALSGEVPKISPPELP